MPGDVTRTVLGLSGQVLAIVVSPAPSVKPGAKFFTRPSDPLQVGRIEYPEGHEIPAHAHRPVERTLVGTPEVLLVRKGEVRAKFYDHTPVTDPEAPRQWQQVDEVKLSAGDVAILLSGGHGFLMEQDTVLWEVKQGPYLDKAADKVTI